MLEETLRKTIQKYGLLKRRDAIVLGVSGGPDSICMLHLFVKLREEYKLKLFCAHFNHMLRSEANEEEDFVKKLGHANHIPCITEKKDVRKLFDGDSLEQTARRLRQDFFLHALRHFKAKKVALAHNKNDVAETVLMRMIRGTALRGLRSILPQSKLRNALIIRPLIEIEKPMILDWLKSNSKEYRVDASNLEDTFFRNKIRLTLLPLLAQYNPNIIGALSNLAQTVAFDYDLLYQHTRVIFEGLKKQRGRNYIKLDIKALAGFSMALFCNVFSYTVEELKGNTRKLELRHYREVYDLLHTRIAFSIVDLPDLDVIKEQHWLVIKALGGRL